MVYQDRPRFPYEPSFSLEGPFSPIGFVLTPPSDGPSLPVAPPHVHEDAPVNYVRVHGTRRTMGRPFPSSGAHLTMECPDVLGLSAYAEGHSGLMMDASIRE